MVEEIIIWKQRQENIMGSKLENVANNTDMAKENEERALEKGSEVVSEVQEAKSILEGIKGMDIEEELIDAAEVGQEAVTDDATAYMNDDVHESIDDAGENVEEVTSESGEQIELNEQASEGFDSIENYGKEQVDQAKEQVTKTSEEFENYSETAEEDLESTEEEHEKQLEDCMG